MTIDDIDFGDTFYAMIADRCTVDQLPWLHEGLKFGLQAAEVDPADFVVTYSAHESLGGRVVIHLWAGEKQANHVIAPEELATLPASTNEYFCDALDEAGETPPEGCPFWHCGQDRESGYCWVEEFAYNGIEGSRESDDGDDSPFRWLLARLSLPAEPLAHILQAPQGTPIPVTGKIPQDYLESIRQNATVDTPRMPMRDSAGSGENVQNLSTYLSNSHLDLIQRIAVQRSCGLGDVVNAVVELSKERLAELAKNEGMSALLDNSPKELRFTKSSLPEALSDLEPADEQGPPIEQTPSMTRTVLSITSDIASAINEVSMELDRPQSWVVMKAIDMQAASLKRLGD